MCVCVCVCMRACVRACMYVGGDGGVEVEGNDNKTEKNDIRVYSFASLSIFLIEA